MRKYLLFTRLQKNILIIDLLSFKNIIIYSIIVIKKSGDSMEFLDRNETNKRKENTKDIKSILKKYKNIKTLNKVIVDEFVEKIYIGKLNKETNTREIKIIWNLDL